MERKKFIKTLIFIIVPVVTVVIGIVVYSWNHYANKNNLFKKFIVDNTKSVYILGTIDKHHFNRINNYSMEDMLAVIENIQPDLVMIDARKDNYEKYNVIDGDIDMCVAFSYCFDHSIPVELVDWWVVDNIYPMTATTNLRDDNIFIKISRKLKSVPPASKTLIICGADHFYEQVARFSVANFKEQEIENKDSYFSSKEESFHYPKLAAKLWKDRAYFYSYSFPLILENDKDLFPAVKEKILNKNFDRYYREQMSYCKYLINDTLY